MADAKPALPRDGTMQVTAKEGEKMLDSVGGAPDEDASTRGQQRKLEEIKNESTPESPAKKAKLTKESTMAVTAKEGKELLGKEKLADTRQETKKAANKPAPKRGQTISKTLEEAKYVLEGKEVDITEGRRTRSQSRPQPPPAKTPVKRAGTMQKTAKEGKEFVKRGAPPKGKGKGKGKKPTDGGDKEDDEDKKEEEEEEKKESEEEDEKKEDGKEDSEEEKKE